MLPRSSDSGSGSIGLWQSVKMGWNYMRTPSFNPLEVSMLHVIQSFPSCVALTLCPTLPCVLVLFIDMQGGVHEGGGGRDAGVGQLSNVVEWLTITPPIRGTTNKASPTIGCKTRDTVCKILEFS